MPTRPPFVPQAEDGVSAVVFPGDDEKRLVGRLFGDDDKRKLGVLLVHRSSSDMRSWFPLARRLRDEGYAAFTLDLRGFGQSEGPKDPVGYPADVSAAIDILGISGITSLAVVGAEIGAVAGIVGSQGWVGISGVAAVEARPVYGKLDGRDEAAKVDEPALILSSSAKHSELADLIPEAELRKIRAGDEPEQTGDVMSAILAFVEREVGRPDPD